MSSMPKDSCTECKQVYRPVDLKTFFECDKHRICKACMGKQTLPSTRSNYEKCPICELSRRRLAAKVRSDLWAEARCKVHCKVCGAHENGQLMSCGHGYCTPCLRKLPRTALSRNLDGSMKSACPKCAKKASQEFREEARAAMLHAEDCARLERDARESRERVEDFRLLREFRAKPRKRQAPEVPTGPAPAPTASTASTASKPKAEVATLVASKGSKGAAAAPAPAAARKVSFNPMVEQKIITPLQRNKRRSLPPVVAGSTSRIAISATPSWLHSSHADSDLSEPITPVEKLRSYSRHWGVNSP